VSEGRFASLNLGRRWGDVPDRVDENLRRLAKASGFAPQRLRQVNQVHGVRVVASDQAGVDADGLWVRRASRLVAGVGTADCVPIVLAEPVAGLAAAVHSGWRGTVGNIAARAVDALVRAGGRPERCLAAVGPCIGWDAFEVGPEVSAQFPASVVRAGKGGRPHVDLRAHVRAQLLAADLTGSSIEFVGGCTHDNPERYFSYRRDGAGVGQHLSFVGWV